MTIFLVRDATSLLYRNSAPNVIHNRSKNVIHAFILSHSNHSSHFRNGLRDNNGTLSFWDRVKRFWGGKDNSQALNFSNDKPLDIAVPLLVVAKPPYDSLIHSSPSEIFSLFSDNAPLRVKEAAMATVTALIGTLYKYTVDATFTTTTESLNTLLNQLHMTGYMLCNAEYRLSLYEKLNNAIPQDNSQGDTPENDPYEGEERLEGGISRTDDLLTFIRQLPEAQTNSLTENASVQAIQVLKSVAQVVVQGLAANSKQQSSLQLDFVNRGNKQFLAPIALPLITQNAVSIKQLCLWHLALGYTVRQIEVRHQIQESLEQDS